MTARRVYPDLVGQDAELTGRHLAYMRHRGLAASTIYHRKRHLIRLAAYLGTPLADATAEQLAGWRAELRTGTAATNGAIACAHQFYAWLSERARLRDDNPAADLVRPKRPRRVARPITEAQLLAALETAPPRIRIWLVLAAWAGLRACEIALLRRECVLDQAEQPVLIIAPDATKGGAGHVVPMSRFVMGELIAYGLPASGWLFGRRDGRPGPNTPARVSHLVNAYLHGLGFTATLHMLRHRFGVQSYRKSGCDLRAVQEMLGHADPASTAIYTAFDLAAGFDAVNALPMPPTATPAVCGQAS